MVELSTGFGRSYAGRSPYGRPRVLRAFAENVCVDGLCSDADNRPDILARGDRHEGFRAVRESIGSRGRAIRIRHPRGGKPRSARIAAHLVDQADPHAPRAGGRLHGGDLRTPDRQGRRLPGNARTRRDELRHRRRLRPARRHADADDHGPETGQGVQAGAFPDRRHRRHDEAADQVHARNASRRWVA